jgi:hypothetical protein
MRYRFTSLLTSNPYVTHEDFQTLVDQSVHIVLFGVYMIDFEPKTMIGKRSGDTKTGSLQWLSK